MISTILLLLSKNEMKKPHLLFLLSNDTEPQIALDEQAMLVFVYLDCRVIVEPSWFRLSVSPTDALL